MPHHRLALLLMASCLTLPAVAAAPPVISTDTDAGATVIPLWNGPAPGTSAWTGAEVDKVIDHPVGKIRIKTNITVPTLTVVRPAPGKANGTAMIVVPGGAFQALAWDMEGTEVARWLADQGITAFVLKYRVRPQEMDSKDPLPSDVPGMMRALAPRRAIAIADAEQAVRLVRGGAAKFGIDAQKIGMMGFSAGAITTIGVVLEGERAVRPDFVASIYGGAMVPSPKLPGDAPPLFIAVAQDDTLAGQASVELFSLWTAAKLPAELHEYEKGGHGFGMRKHNLPVDAWPAAFAAWLRSRGLLPAL